LAFKRLFDSGNNQSLLNACGHDNPSFRSLLELFQPLYDLHFPNKSSGFIQPVATTSTLILFLGHVLQSKAKQRVAQQFEMKAACYHTLKLGWGTQKGVRREIPCSLYR
jgi:hypothetical protein